MSDLSIVELLLIQLILILLNAIFACAEIAVISINDNKLLKMAENGRLSAKLLVALTKQPAKFLATIQIGITLAGFLGSAFAADNFSDRVVDWLVAQGVTISPAKLDVLSVVGITIILSYVTLVLGELVPKRVAMQYAEKIGLFMSYSLFLISKLFSPIVWFLTISTNLVLKIIGINPESKNNQVTEEEIRIMIDVGTENGAINLSEKKMIHNVFEFNDKRVCEVMTHRTKVVYLNRDLPPARWEAEMIRSRHAIYPLFQGTYDNIIGTINIKDYLRYKNQKRRGMIDKMIHPIQFVPEFQRIDELFSQMQKNRNHFAVVVDEYGGICGIITMNDLLKQLVGELEDDALVPPSEPLIQKIGEQMWLIQGNTPIEEAASCLKMIFKQGEYDTFAGFVLSLMRSIPKNKKNLKLRYKNLDILVPEINGYKIPKVIVRFVSNPNFTKMMEK